MGGMKRMRRGKTLKMHPRVSATIARRVLYPLDVVARGSEHPVFAVLSSRERNRLWGGVDSLEEHNGDISVRSAAMSDWPSLS